MASGDTSRPPLASGPVPTLEDVAREAGVSTATVSRCLNSPELVVEKTRERVLDVVRALGYAPNFGARVLAAKRTNAIGAIIPTMENAIFARGLQAFQEELGRHGVTLLVSSSSYSPEIEEEQIRMLTARGADALLLIGHDRRPEAYDFLRRRGVPFLVAWAYNSDKPSLSIGFDNRISMKTLAERVIGLGHRRIGIITAERATNDRARERVEGILEAVAESSADPASVRIEETTYSFESGARAFETLMSSGVRPSVVMCGNDVLAVGALDMADRMGLGVPRDVSVTGFDDIEIAQISRPRLTTVHVPHREMGRQAAQMLVATVAGRPPQASVLLETDIRMRETLGPATS